MKILKLVIAVFLLGSCNAQNNNITLKTNNTDNTLLWEISGKQLSKPSYLFGTFHLICKDDIPFGPQLKTAVKSVNEVYMELDMDDPGRLTGALQLMNMKGDTTLKSLYSTEEYKKLQLFFSDSLQMPLAMFQSMKPVFLEAMLYPKMLPCKTMSGVEEELLLLAKENKKPIQGLETMAFQASVFDSIPYTGQAKELLKAIDSLQAYKKYFEVMVKAYKSQQLKKMQELLSNKDFGMEDNQDILLDKRNKNWVTQLNTIMKKESVFIAVGAGHLVGDMGLISLLRKEGYKVRPVEN
ncbi:TraB/GumN family protein [Ferruginibacter sp. SUN106]|uniref:TraB/GumN family protein n=1 Tax=Ferruginibacter sp. SUN106 TaxID=2978348 RepID=UPI003D365297